MIGRPMRRVLAAVVLLLVLATPAFATAAQASKVKDPDQTAAQLAKKFVGLVARHDEAGLRKFLSSAFIIQRADGSFYTKSDYLEHLPTVGKFEINNVAAKLTGSVLVARFDLTVTAVTNGVPQSTTPAPRLSTFVRDHGRWQLAAYANFNTPAPTNG